MTLDCRRRSSWCTCLFLRRRQKRRRPSGINVTKPETPLLDQIASPADLRNLSESELVRLADELRAETISAVSVTGGHLGAGLGVVELTVALHYVFNTPTDRIVWDVGHQAYPHKILTGRRPRIRTLRQGGGLSGFTRRSESEYDAFGAGHSSTSISAALGMAVARDLSHGVNNVVAVIGDGAMSAGMAYEAMNNAGAMGSRLIVILNDNDMSIAPPTGAMSAYLARLVTSHTYRSLRDVAKQLAKRLPKFLYDKAKRTEEYGRGFWTGGTLFEELGLLLCRADRRPQARPPPAHPEERARHARRAGAGPRRDEEGQGLSAGRGRRRQISRRRPLRRHYRRAGENQEQRPVLHQGVRRRAARCGAARRQGGRGHRRHASGDRPRQDAGGVSRAGVRRRHRRTARGDLLGRTGQRRLQALLRDLFDLSAARLRPAGARRGGPEPARPLRHRPRRSGRRRRANACRGVRPRLSRLPAEHDGDGGGRRSRTRSHGRDRGRPRRRSDRAALPAG